MVSLTLDTVKFLLILFLIVPWLDKGILDGFFLIMSAY
mgnify:CR=1 FL=1